MTITTLIGRVLVALVAPLAGYLASRYHQPELGTILVGGIAAIGGELLLRQSPPGTFSLPKGTGVGSIPTTLLLLLALPLLHGCAFLQKPGTQKVVRCTGAVIDGCKETAMASVTACLLTPASTPCLLALVNDGVCASREALACNVREAEQPAATPSLHALLASPVSPDPRIAERAQQFYDAAGITPVAP